MARAIGRIEKADCYRCGDRLLRKTLIKDGYTGKMVCRTCYDDPEKKKRVRINQLTGWEE